MHEVVRKRASIASVSVIGLTCLVGSFSAVWVFLAVDSSHARLSMAQVSICAVGLLALVLPSGLMCLRAPRPARVLAALLIGSLAGIVVLTPAISFFAWPAVFFAAQLAVWRWVPSWSGGTRKVAGFHTTSGRAVYVVFVVAVFAAFYGMDLLLAWMWGSLCLLLFLLPLLLIGLPVALIAVQVWIIRERGAKILGRAWRTGWLLVASYTGFSAEEIGVYTYVWRMESVYLEQARIAFGSPRPGDVRIPEVVVDMFPDDENPVVAQFWLHWSHGDVIGISYMPKHPPANDPNSHYYENLRNRRLWGDWYY